MSSLRDHEGQPHRCRTSSVPPPTRCRTLTATAGLQLLLVLTLRRREVRRRRTHVSSASAASARQVLQVGRAAAPGGCGRRPRVLHPVRRCSGSDRCRLVGLRRLVGLLHRRWVERWRRRLQMPARRLHMALPSRRSRRLALLLLLAAVPAATLPGPAAAAPALRLRAPALRLRAPALWLRAPAPEVVPASGAAAVRHLRPAPALPVTWARAAPPTLAA